MTSDERDLNPEINTPPESASINAGASQEDLRFAPPVDDEAAKIDLTEEEETPPPPSLFPASETDAISMSVSDDMDIEAALAAVSNLSDMLAEREAAEQARLAREEAAAQSAAERRARLEHPEQFFPVPPLSVLHRGQMASVVPALLLILLGAGLTLALTTSAPAFDPGVLASLALGVVALILLARWLTSGRWSHGALFFGLALLFGIGVAIYLGQPGSPGWAGGWPLLLIALGMAFLLTAFLAYPRDTRLILPGGLLAVAGAAGLVATLSILDSNLLVFVGSLWPVALALLAVVWLLPLIFRQRG